MIALITPILTIVGPFIGWLLLNVMKNKAMADNWEKSYMSWLKFEQNQIPIAATEKNRVRAQIAGLKKMREDRKKPPQ